MNCKFTLPPCKCKTRILCKPNPSNSPLESSTQHAFFRDFRFFWILLKVLGLFPYKINKNGDVTFDWFSKEMMISIVTFTITSGPVLMVLYLRYQQHVASSGNFDVEIHVYMMSVVMFPHLAVPLTHWCDLKRFQATFKKWREFQIRYEDTLSKKLVLRVNWTYHVFFLIIIFFTCFAVIVQFFIQFSQYPWELVAYLYMILFLILHKVLLMGLCLRLTNVGRCFRAQVLQAMREENVELLTKMASLWISLSEAVRLIGSLFYRTFGYIMLLLFSVSTIMMYSLLRALACNIFRTNMLYLATCLASNNMWVFLLCESAERLSLEVGNKFIASVAKLRPQIKNPELRYEVDSFLAAIASYPPVVSFNEYVTVNRRLFVTINSTMCTYLIVVLQFSQEFNVDAVYGVNSTQSGLSSVDLIA